MILFIELLVILVLMLIWFSVSREESQKIKDSISKATLREIWEGTERRRSFRLPVSLEVRYVIEKKIQASLKSRSKNISSGGIMLEAEEKIYPGTPLKLEIILLDNKPPIQTEAEVIWVDEANESDNIEKRHFNIGAKFIYLNNASLKRIDEYVKQKREDSNERET